MKKHLFLLIITLLLINCDSNDDAQTNPTNPTNSTDGFTRNEIFYETPNAYFEIDEEDDNADNYPDEYNFFFSNGKMFDNDNNVNGSSGDYLFSLNTSNWVFLNLTIANNPSFSSSPPTAGNTYIANTNDSVIIENGQINGLTPPYFINSLEFGTGDENTGTINTPTSQPSVTINAINLDSNNPSESTIDVDYSFTNQNGVVITGHYEGTFGVILD